MAILPSPIASISNLRNRRLSASLKMLDDNGVDVDWEYDGGGIASLRSPSKTKGNNNMPPPTMIINHPSPLNNKRRLNNIPKVCITGIVVSLCVYARIIMLHGDQVGMARAITIILNSPTQGDIIGQHHSRRLRGTIDEVRDSIIVGIVLDASVMAATGALSFLVDMACEENVGSHILTSHGAEAAGLSLDLTEKYNTNSCAKITFATDPENAVSGASNRVDRIAQLRDHQRGMLLEEWQEEQRDIRDESSAVIVIDFDLNNLPSSSILMAEITRMITQGTDDVVCAAGTFHHPFPGGYYDTFATILLPNTFVYPVSGRFNKTIHNDEDPHFIVSDDSSRVDSFTQLDLLDYFKRESINGQPVPVRSCFGGIAIYRSNIWANSQCQYGAWKDRCSSKNLRYATSVDGRQCEHVTFNECLRAELKGEISIGVQPILAPEWGQISRTTELVTSDGHLTSIHSKKYSQSVDDYLGDQLISANEHRYRARIRPEDGNFVIEDTTAVTRNLTTSSSSMGIIWEASPSKGVNSIVGNDKPSTSWVDCKRTIKSTLGVRGGQIVLSRTVSNESPEICESDLRECTFEVWSTPNNTQEAESQKVLSLSPMGALELIDQDRNRTIWSSSLSPLPVSFHNARCPSTLPPSFKLYQGEYICSPNGRYFLTLNSSRGLFVGDMERDQDVFESMQNSASRRQSQLILQSDGNLVAISSEGGPVWSSNTTHQDNENSHLILFNDGSARIVNAYGVAVYEVLVSGLCPTMIPVGGVLTIGNQICSSTGEEDPVQDYSFGITKGGSLGLHRHRGGRNKVRSEQDMIWNSEESSLGLPSINIVDSSLVLQDDGNLVLHDGHRAIWASNTSIGTHTVLDLAANGTAQLRSLRGTTLFSISEQDGIQHHNDPAQKHIMLANAVIHEGDSVCSLNGHYCFGIDLDANAPHIFRNLEMEEGSPSIPAVSSSRSVNMIMQNDGNLVVFGSASNSSTSLTPNVFWSSETEGTLNVDSKVLVNDYGSAEIVNRHGMVTYSQAAPGICPRWLHGDEVISQEDEGICSPNGDYRLQITSDGDLAIMWEARGKNTAHKVWSIGSCCDDFVLRLQSDGNLILQGTYKIRWQTNTEIDTRNYTTHHPGLRVTDTGTAMIQLADGTIVWRSTDMDSQGDLVLGSRERLDRQTVMMPLLPGCEVHDVEFGGIASNQSKHQSVKAYTRQVVFLGGEEFVAKKNRTLMHQWSFLGAIKNTHKKKKKQVNISPSEIMNECVEEDWQSSAYFNCNSIHEVTDMQGDRQYQFLGQGSNNQGWSISQSDDVEVVLKRQRLNNMYSPKYYERTRVESLIMQEMTSSSGSLNAYGACGTSIVSEGGNIELSSVMNNYHSPLEILGYATRLASALADLHSKGLLHTDLTPSNILMSQTGRVILHDFDQAAILARGIKSNTTCGVRMNDDKCDHYRSPEKCSSNQVLTFASDVYGLGGVLFYLISGFTPYTFPVDSPIEIIRQNIRNGILPAYPPRIMASDNEAIVIIRSIIAKCFEYDPSDRPKAREIAAQLFSVLERLQGSLKNDDKLREFNEIQANQILQQGESIKSLSGQYSFGIDSNGTLALISNGETLWSTKEHGDSLAMQPDGNLVLEKEGDTTWSSNTGSPENAGSFLALSNEGAVEIISPRGICVYKIAVDTLAPGRELDSDSLLRSLNGRYQFGINNNTGDLTIWQIRKDDNVILGDSGDISREVIWSYGLCCQTDGIRAELTSGGNFVVKYDSGILFDTGTEDGRHDSSIVMISNDGKVMMQNPMTEDETVMFDPSLSRNPAPGAVVVPIDTNVGQAHVVDPSTMHNKVLTGYQGWFTTPCDDGLKRWHHWSDRVAPSNQTATFDLWPEMDEYDDDEKCKSDFSYQDGRKASLFSSYNPKTVDRHIQWMRDYGIDGSIVQRFVTDTKVFRHMRDVVLKNVQASSQRHGRVFANMYDLTGATHGQATVDDVKKDWKHLVDGLQITKSPQYLQHNGRPVLGIFFGKVTKSPVSAAEASALIDWLQNNPEERYRATVLGAGIGKDWRTNRLTKWMPVYNKFDVVSPWTIGRYRDDASVDHHIKKYTAPDIEFCHHESSQEYMPVVFPGFSSREIRRRARSRGSSVDDTPLNEIPRNGGAFLWRQLYHSVRSGANMIFVAMFDEVDEGTAIMKVAPSDVSAPSNGDFLTLDADEGHNNLPSDWYLRLVGEASRLLRTDGSRNEFPLNIPISPPLNENANLISTAKNSIGFDTHNSIYMPY